MRWRLEDLMHSPTPGGRSGFSAEEAEDIRRIMARGAHEILWTVPSVWSPGEIWGGPAVSPPIMSLRVHRVRVVGWDGRIGIWRLAFDERRGRWVAGDIEWRETFESHLLRLSPPPLMPRSTEDDDLWEYGPDAARWAGEPRA